MCFYKSFVFILFVLPLKGSILFSIYNQNDQRLITAYQLHLEKNKKIVPALVAVFGTIPTDIKVVIDEYRNETISYNMPSICAAVGCGASIFIIAWLYRYYQYKNGRRDGNKQEESMSEPPNIQSM